MFDLSALFPPRERTNDDARSSHDATAALGRMVGAAQDTASRVRAPSTVEDLARRVGPHEQRRADVSIADLSRLVGERPIGARSRPADSTDASAALAQRVGDTEFVDERGWQAPEMAQPARRPLLNGRRAFGSVNLLSLAVAVVAVALLCGSAALAVVQRVTSDPAAEAMTSLREREAELQNETQVLATARGLYTAARTDASDLAEAVGDVIAELDGVVDQAALQSIDRARASVVAELAGLPSIAVPEYGRMPIDQGSVAEVAVAIDKARAAKDALGPLISDARGARTEVVASWEALKGELRAADSAVDAAAAKAIGSNSAAADVFRSAVTDAATRVRVAHEGGGDGVTELSEFASAVKALRDENQRVLDLERSGTGAPVRRSPSVPGGSTGGDPTQTPPVADTGSTTDPGAGGANPSPDPSQAPTAESSASPETGLPLPTP